MSRPFPPRRILLIAAATLGMAVLSSQSGSNRVRADNPFTFAGVQGPPLVRTGSICVSGTGCIEDICKQITWTEVVVSGGQSKSVGAARPKEWYPYGSCDGISKGQPQSDCTCLPNHFACAYVKAYSAYPCSSPLPGNYLGDYYIYKGDCHP